MTDKEKAKKELVKEKVELEEEIRAVKYDIMRAKQRGESKKVIDRLEDGFILPQTQLRAVKYELSQNPFKKLYYLLKDVGSCFGW